jgi:hypothetical protein
MWKTLLCCALTLWSTSAIAIECKTSKPSNTRTHWAWRQIEGRQCWYEGRPGVPKESLHWPKSKPDEPKPGLEQEPEQTVAAIPPADHHANPAAVALAEEVMPADDTEEPVPARTPYDEILLNTCCWPQLDSEVAALPEQTAIERPSANSADTWRLFLFFAMMAGLLGFPFLRRLSPIWDARSRQASKSRHYRDGSKRRRNSLLEFAPASLAIETTTASISARRSVPMRASGHERPRAQRVFKAPGRLVAG